MHHHHEPATNVTGTALAKIARFQGPDGRYAWQLRNIGTSCGVPAQAARAHCPLLNHPAPHPNCSCGFHLNEPAATDAPEVGYFGVVHARVTLRGTGTILPTGTGWRCGEQHLEAVVVPDRCAVCDRRLTDYGIDRGELAALCADHSDPTVRVPIDDLARMLGVDVTTAKARKESANGPVHLSSSRRGRTTRTRRGRTGNPGRFGRRAA